MEKGYRGLAGRGRKPLTAGILHREIGKEESDEGEHEKEVRFP